MINVWIVVPVVLVLYLLTSIKILRELPTRRGVSVGPRPVAEHNTTIVFPLPIDLIAARTQALNGSNKIAASRGSGPPIYTGLQIEWR